jgi:hypothetical protein
MGETPALQAAAQFATYGTEEVGVLTDLFWRKPEKAVQMAKK